MTVKMRIAVLRTILAYKRLIKSPETELPKWKNYGRFKSCHLCKANGVKSCDDIVKCYTCVLAFEVPDRGNTLCCEHTFQVLRAALRSPVPDYNRIRLAATERLEYIKNKKKRFINARRV